MADVDTIPGIAAALRQDPVLVQELLGNGRTDDVHDALSALVDDLADQGVAAYVALVQTPNDVQLPTGADAGDALARLVHQELGQPGVYVVATPDTLTSIATYEVPVDSTSVSLGRYDALDSFRSGLPEGEFVPTPGEAAMLLAAAADPENVVSPDEASDLLTSGPFVAAYGDEPMSYDLEDARGEPETPVVFAAAFALVALVIGWRLLRARTAWAGGAELPAPRPRAARSAGRTPARGPAPDRTPEQARKAVRALRREVDTSLRPVPDEVYGCLEVAEDLLGGSPLDVLGALVLAEQGSARLTGDELPVRCYFDPRHGAQARRVTVSGVALPACEACAAAVDAGRAPASLAGHRGRPYWREDTVWASTGFGALDPDLWRLVAERRP